MTVWRLNSHPSDAGRAARWFTRDCLVAIGWGDVGDLRRAAPASSGSIATLIRKVDPDSTDSQLGGQALWCFFHDMVVGDLVLVGDGSVGDVVMRIDGEYEWSGQVSPVAPGDYQHQRRASLTTIDATELWASCGRRIADGEDRRWRLARCAPTVVPAGKAGATPVREGASID
jgi:hypothetical protein